MSRFEDLVAAIRNELAAIEEGQTLTARGQAALTETHDTLSRLSRGSNNYRLTVTVEALAAAITALERAGPAEVSAVEKIDTYLTAIGAVGVSPAPQSSTPTSSPPSSRSGTFDQDDWLAKLPKRGSLRSSGVRHIKTEGIWHGGSGLMARFRSGIEGPYAEMSKVFWDKGIWGGSPPQSDSWTHAELQFAVFMRASGKREEEITINFETGPCDDCLLVLPFYLKEGAKLTVNWPEGSDTYEGRQEHERPDAHLLRQLKARKRR